MTHPTTRPLAFDSRFTKATWLSQTPTVPIQGRTIVANVGETEATVCAPIETTLLPRHSTILESVTLKDAASLVLVEVVDETNIGGIILDPAWKQLGQIADYPKDAPLWKSPQYDVGVNIFDPYAVTGQSRASQPDRRRRYQTKVNLWFAPAKTNCAIHNHHMTPEFLEVHTQIYGIGRMQKFYEKDFGTLYQDVILGPGETHLPFAVTDPRGAFIYPWHQYYADTDCIWMAIEYHPLD